MLDGYLKIKTKLDNKGIDKDITELENKINKLQTDNAEASKEQSGLQKEIEDYEQLQNEAEKYRQKIKQIQQEKNNFKGQLSGKIQGYEAGVTESNYSNSSAQLEQVKQKYQEINAEIEKQAPKIDKVYTKLDKVKAKQTENNKKISQFKAKIDQVKMDKVKEDVDNVGKGLTSTIGKIGKMALAVFGIRTAFNAVRSAVSIISQYNPQVATDIEYIRYALAQTILPIVQKLISFVYTLLSYINAIAKAWFGVNLFANSSAKSFKNAAKNAKEISKATQSFDEMNITQDNNNNSTGSASPSMDLSQDGIKDVKVPTWITWIKDNWKIIVGALLAIVGAIALLAIFGNKDKGLQKIGTSFTGFFNSLGKATEAIAILGGLTLVIKAISELITEFANSGLTLGEVAGLLGIVFGELAIAFTALAAASNLMDWTGIAGAVVIFGGMALVLSQVTKLINTFSKSGMTLGEVGGLLAIVFGSIIALMGAVVLLGPAMTAGLLPFSALIVEISALLGVMAITLPIILEACDKFITDVAPVISSLLTTIGDIIDRIIYALGDTLPPIINSVGSLFTKIFDGIESVIDTIGNNLVKILNTVQNLVVTVLNSILGFINGLGPAINKFIDNVISGVTKLINFLISGIEYLVNTLIVNGINKIISAVNSVSQYVGINIPRVSQMSIPRFVPRLAKGGIIAQPTMAVVGEAGKEAVMPLENNLEWLDILADKLASRMGNNNGSYIIQMDGRVLQRGMARQQNRLAFETNGGV